MGDVRMSGEDSIQSHAAGITRRGKLAANVVHECVCFMVDLLFGNCQDLTEVALDGCLNRTVALDGLQMPGA